MIKRLKYDEIDFDKYEACLTGSVQFKYSAEKRFLDVVACRKWEILVYGDYQSVMPIPYIKKFNIKVVVNPKLCQQLGIFSKNDSREINDLFLNYFEKNYRIWYYAFNETNQFSANLFKRKNYLIESDLYENVYKKYSPKRKRKLRLDQEVSDQSHIEEVLDLNEVEKFIRTNLKGIEKEEDRSEYLRIYRDFYKDGALKFIGFYYQSRMTNLIAVHQSECSVALLGTFNDKDFIRLNGTSTLIDFAIKKYISHRIFDFEGSEVPSVEEFFRGFRPELRLYSVIQTSKLNLLKKIFY